MIINPDPIAENYRMSDEEILKIYHLASAQGGFNGSVFIKEVERRWEAPAVGSAVTKLMALLSEGKLFLTSSMKTVRDIAKIIGTERDMLARKYAYEKIKKIVYM